MFTNFKNLELDLFEYVEDLMGISLDETDKKHLKENLGIIYATDGENSIGCTLLYLKLLLALLSINIETMNTYFHLNQAYPTSGANV